MLNLMEVSETNSMIEQEQLDVRTITMGINLLDSLAKTCRTFVVKLKQKSHVLRKI